MPLSAAERQKKYRERLKKNYPEKWEETKRTDAEKKRTQYKKISELSDNEKAKRRKLWRNLKQKNVQQQYDKERKIMNRKVYKQRYYKLTKENKKQKRKIDILRKKVDSLRKTVYRYKLLMTCQKNNNEEKENFGPSVSLPPTSPLSKTESFINELKGVPTPQKDKVRKVLFEKNVLREAFTNTYQNANCNADRNVLKNVVNNDLVQKYKMKTQFSDYLGLKGRVRTAKQQVNIKETKLGKQIREFFLQDDVSRATAGKRETKTHKKEKIQKRYLLDNLVHLHKKFKIDTGTQTSYATFIRYKPFYVVKPKLSDRDTCACKKHANIEFKFNALKRLSVLNQHNTVNDLVNSLVCNPKCQECMYLQCGKCKNKEVRYDFDKTSLNEHVSWVEWGIKNVEYKKDNVEKTSKRCTKAIMSTTLQDLISKFEIDLQHFKKHLYNISHQYKMYKDMKDTLDANEVLLHCDFSENYNCKMHKEIQAVHFGASQFQITLHTSVVYQENKKPQCYCTLSNSTNHSPEAIWAHLKPILTDITKNTPEIDTIHFFSDGPSTQYKQKKNFFLFNTIIKDFGLTGTWNFFEAAHGKGAADGVGGVIKRSLDEKVSHGKDVLSAESAYMLLENETKVKLLCIDEEDITSIEQDNKQSIKSLIAVPKTMQIHQIQATNQSRNIASRILSCFCARSPKRGFCDCFSVENHNLLKSHQRTRRLPSYTSSDSSERPDNEHITVSRNVANSGNTIFRDKHVTVLADVRVNYDRETLQTLMGTSKRYNMCTNDIRQDFKEMIVPDSSLPSTSNTDGGIRITTTTSPKIRHNFFNLSDDSDEDIF